MSVVLSVYTSSAFRDYLLPAVNNSNYDLILKGRIFALEEDIVLKLEIIDGAWSLLGSEEYSIADEKKERRQGYGQLLTKIAILVGENEDRDVSLRCHYPNKYLKKL